MPFGNKSSPMAAAGGVVIVVKASESTRMPTSFTLFVLALPILLQPPVK